MTRPEFEFPVRIYIEDTDAGGIVFYANYLKFFERARTELVRSVGVSLREGLSEDTSYVVHSVELKYKAPAVLDDEIVVTASVAHVARTYMDFEQTARHVDGRVLVVCKVRVACVALSNLKPKALPAELADALVLLQ